MLGCTARKLKKYRRRYIRICGGTHAGLVTMLPASRPELRQVPTDGLGVVVACTEPLGSTRTVQGMHGMPSSKSDRGVGGVGGVGGQVGT
jgi:hypothetical protein